MKILLLFGILLILCVFSDRKEEPDEGYTFVIPKGLVKAEAAAASAGESAAETGIEAATAAAHRRCTITAK